MPEDETASFTVTTSDMPVIEELTTEQEPAPKEEPKEEPQPTEEEQPRQKSRAQKRIEALANEKRELLRENAELKEKLGGASKTPVVDLDPDDFDDYDDYLEAVEKQSSTKQTNPEEDPVAEIVDPLANFRDEMEAKFDYARDAHPDFDDKIKAMPTLTVNMLEAITESDEAGEVAYYLADNPDVAEKMSVMSPTKMAIEIGKIELKLQTPVKEDAKPAPKPKQTQTPAPITPVNGGGEFDKSLSDMSFAEFEKTRNTEASAKKFW